MTTAAQFVNPGVGPTLDRYAAEVGRERARREFLSSRVQQIEQGISEMRARLTNVDQAQAFAQEVARETQEQLRYRIEDVVQLAQDAVFPDEYDFRVVFEVKRGRTEARLCFMRNGVEVDPLSSSGGGVADVVSFALRLAVWSLGRTRPVIILDEPFRFLSRDLQPRAGEMLRRLSARLRLQVIMVSHEAEMIDIADRVFSVRLVRDGEYKKSEVRQS